MRILLPAALLVLASAVGCAKDRRQPDNNSAQKAHELPPANFQLVCESVDTHTQSIEFCLRIDTRNGNIVRVDATKIPRSNGPTKTADRAAGTYQLVCDATNTATKSDLSCLRINRVTGDLLLVTLPKIPQFP